MLAALVVHALLSSGIVTFGLGDVILAGGKVPQTWVAVAGLSFVAGFAEHLVPTVLDRVMPTENASTPPLLQAATTAAALVDLRHAVKQTVDQSLSGTDLVRYDGYVSGSVERDRSDTRQVRLRLRFSMYPHEGALRLSLGDGAVQPTADFIILSQPDNSPRFTVRSVVTVPTTEDFFAPTIALDVPDAAGAIWVKLLQGQRLLQMIEVPLATASER
jgi:hypothetical protein